MIISTCSDCPFLNICKEQRKHQIFTISRKSSGNVRKPYKSRVLTPDEFESIEFVIPKFKHKLLFRVALATGMRYEELQRLTKEGKTWLVERDGRLYIHLPEEHKTQRTMRERWIRLSYWGQNQVRDLFSQKPIPKYPSYVTWHENLQRWAIKANVCPLHLSPKVTRKTWESWLITLYPHEFNQIVLSQGHTATVSLMHYQNLAFSEIDKMKMKKYLDGWV